MSTVLEATRDRTRGIPVRWWTTLDRAYLAGHPDTPARVLSLIAAWATDTWADAHDEADPVTVGVTRGQALDIARILAKNPHLPTTEVARLVRHGLWRAGGPDLLGRSDIPVHVLVDAFLNEVYPAPGYTGITDLIPAPLPLYDALAAHPDLSPEIADLLTDQGWAYPAVTRFTASIPVTEPGTLARLASHPDLETRVAVLNNPRTPEEQRIMLALSVPATRRRRVNTQSR